MKTIAVFGIIACFVIINVAAAQEAETEPCRSIHTAMEAVMKSCNPSHPPTEANLNCMEQGFSNQAALSSIYTACSSKPTMPERGKCFKGKLQDAGCQPPQHPSNNE